MSISPGKLRVRLWGRRLLATWLCLLRRWAGNRLAGAGVGAGGAASSLKSGNKAFQDALRQVFAPYYHLCPECGSFCCQEAAIPYSALDRGLHPELIPGGAPRRGQPGVRKKAGLRRCWRRADLYRKLKFYSRQATFLEPGVERAEDDGGARPFCPALGDTGCRLPWGERPVVCVVCSCPDFLGTMSWKDFVRYLWLSGRYLAYLTRIVGKLEVRAAAG